MKTSAVVTSAPVAALVLAANLVPTVVTAAGQTLRLGPFVVGMSVDEARAAAPDLAWRDTAVSKYTGRTLSIAADDAVTIGSLRHSVALTPGHYNWYYAVFRHSESVPDAPACERLSLPVVAELEANFGEFWAIPRFDKRRLSSPSDLQRTTQGLADLAGANLGVPIRRRRGAQARAGTPRYVLVEAGGRSLMSFETNEDADGLPRTDDPRWRLGIAEQMRPVASPYPETDIRLESYYSREDASARTCQLTTIISYTPLRPPWETIEVTPAVLTQRPSIAYLHLSLDGVTLPAPATNVKLYCAVARPTGRFLCSRAPKEKADAALVIAATMRSRAMQLAPATLDPDNPVNLRTTLSVTLAQAERRAIDFVDAPSVATGEIQWAATPDESTLQSAYPADLLKQGQTGVVALVCQIQSDLSPLCVPASPLDGGTPAVDEVQAKFAWSARAMLSLYTAAPLLKSGAPAAGAVFSTRISFKPGD